MNTQPRFGRHVRKQREALLVQDHTYSVRGVARKLDCQPAYISTIERGTVGPPSETMVKKLAETLGEDADELLALAGKISADLREIILHRPKLFAELIRLLQDAPDDAVSRLIHELGQRKYAKAEAKRTHDAGERHGP